jgi:predicted porin
MLLVGAYTDFTSYTEASGTNELMHGFGNFDSYHISTGFSFHKPKQTISLGFTYAFTPNENIPPYTIINQTPAADQALLSSHSFSIVMGYTYYFAKYSEK